MLKASIVHLSRRIESLFAVANFGAASLFWLAIAFLISPSEYGVLMTLQAAVLLLVALFTLRTHDLVYYLTGSRGYSLSEAYRTALTIELAAAVLCAGIGLLVILTIGSTRIAQPELAAVFVLVATAVVVQQGSVVRLRRMGRTRLIVAADSATLASWLGVGGYVLVGMPGPREMLLVLGAAPQAVRSALLLVGALLAPREAGGCANKTDWKSVARFIAGGQSINFVKNGATSLETMIVAAFAGPAVVAMYRLTKSTQGLAAAISNVAFQQGSNSIAATPDPERRQSLWRQVRRRGIRACIATYPAGALFALAYAWQKPEIGLLEFQAIMAGSYIAFFPLVLLQGSFIVVSLAGRHRVVNRAYLVSTAVLLLLCASLFLLPSIWAFLAALTLSNYLRLWLLDREAARDLQTLATPPTRRPVPPEQADEGEGLPNRYRGT